MTQQPHGRSGWRFESQVAAAGAPGPGRTAANRKADRAPSAWAVLDRLRDAAAAHDGDLPALKVPEPLSGQSA
jgi:hypothetical protein